jgi:hypothetical protein
MLVNTARLHAPTAHQDVPNISYDHDTKNNIYNVV